MPLIKGKSDASRSANIATEIKAGRPRDQAIAIGYSVQRKAQGQSGAGHARASHARGKAHGAKHGG